MEEEKKVPSLYDKLNIAPPTKEEALPTVIETESSIDADFNKVQENLHAIIDIGKEALDNIADIAHQSQDAEAYTTVASVMNSLVAANKELLDAHRRKQLVKKGESAPQNSTGNTNIMNITLTTAQLTKMLRGESID